MLLRKAILDKIESGEVDLAFRRWTRPTVKSGGTLRTQVGLVRIGAVEKVSLDEIDETAAKRAGATLDDLVSFLGVKEEGEIYRVELVSIGSDPRVALREDANLTQEDVDTITSRLGRLDAASKRGPWTRQLLELLAANPHVRAQDLADGLGLEKLKLKNDVRKLKTLGLTISHSPGYELSPRGEALLDAWLES
jgi:hypothetical protein